MLDTSDHRRARALRHHVKLFERDVVLTQIESTDQPIDRGLAASSFTARFIVRSRARAGSRTTRSASGITSRRFRHMYQTIYQITSYYLMIETQ